MQSSEEDEQYHTVTQVQLKDISVSWGEVRRGFVLSTEG